MTIEEATEMIRFRSDGVQKDAENWADLGCGTGTFTLALADTLPPGSGITAVDSDVAVLKKIPGSRNQVNITTIAAEMTGCLSRLKDLNGLLMANSLHFIRDQPHFVETLKETLNPGGTLLLVEYDMLKGSRWVPYPLAPVAAQKLFEECGFTQFNLLARRPSRYGPQFLYSAVVRV